MPTRPSLRWPITGLSATCSRWCRRWWRRLRRRRADARALFHSCKQEWIESPGCPVVLDRAFVQQKDFLDCLPCRQRIRHKDDRRARSRFLSAKPFYKQAAFLVANLHHPSAQSAESILSIDKFHRAGFVFLFAVRSFLISASTEAAISSTVLKGP